MEGERERALAKAGKAKKGNWYGGQGKVKNSLGSKREREFHWQNHVWTQGSSSDIISSLHPTSHVAIQGPQPAQFTF